MDPSAALFNRSAEVFVDSMFQSSSAGSASRSSLPTWTFFVPPAFSGPRLKPWLHADAGDNQADQ